MVRNLIVTALLAVAIAFGAAWYFNLWPSTENTASGNPRGPDPVSTPAVDVGKLLYVVIPLPKDPLAPRQAGPDPIIVACHLIPLDNPDVPAKREGPIKFIGTEVDREDPNAPGSLMSVIIHQGRADMLKTYRPLEEGYVVAPQQMIALVDCGIALNEVISKRAKIIAAKADYDASKATHQEAQARLSRLDTLRRTNARAVPEEEFGAAVLLRDKYRYEEAAKGEAVKLAEIERDQAEIVLKEHEIRNPLHGAAIIKTIYKKRGVGVKALEPVVQLQSLENLRAEGMIEVQYLERLRTGMKVSIEPSQFEAPYRVLKGHKGEITSVAFTNAEQPQVVSASEDGTVFVWNLLQFGPQRVLFHDDQPVRVLACSPKGSKHNLCVTGCADGSLRVWNLAAAAEASRLEDSPRAAVTALAFSPDGRFFACGTEDNQISLWSAEAGKKLYDFDAAHGSTNGHQGTITSLHFTPQCKLVSAARDNTLRVWELHEQGVKMEPHVVYGRGGSVSNLGVTQDGRWMLFDQGKTLQVLSVADGKTVNLLQNPANGAPFETLALFSPDASLVLTAGAPEGRLQLWRAPGVSGRAYEVRQFATMERAPVSCAAFAHDAGLTQQGSYAVSGTKDGNVYVWMVPNQEVLNQYRIENLPLTLVERSAEAGTRQVRIGVNVHNPVSQQHPYGRLMPGRPVTVVIEP